MFGQLEREINEILTYIKNIALGIVIEQPQLNKKIAIDLLEVFLSIINKDKQNNQALQQLILQSANLSNFDVNISSISNKLKEYSEQLATSSESNMTVVEETTASVSEVSSAIKNNTKKTVTLSSDAEDLMSSNKTNQQQIQEINQLKEVVVKNSEAMRQEISELREVSLQVDEIVNGVGEIAEQTNLLALNASIEAARAGENGRGFAVVADEIRKLAEDTKERLNHMQGFTARIRDANNQSLSTVESTISSMEKMAKKIVLLGKSFEESTDNLQRVLENASELASVMEEITAVSEEITKVMQQSASASEQISHLSEAVMNDATEISHIATNISVIDDEISDVNSKLMKNVNTSFKKISNEDFIRHLKEAVEVHKNWVNRLSQMVDQKTIVPIQSNGKKCKFGHFYHIVQVEHPEIKAEWEKIDSIHHELHSQVPIITEQIKQNDDINAQQTIEYTKSLSRQIIELMETIIQRTVNVSKKGETVF